MGYSKLLTVAASSAPTVDVSKITTAITSAVDTGTIMGVMASVVGTGMAFVLVWWAARKIKAGALSAIFKGKLKF